MPYTGLWAVIKTNLYTSDVIVIAGFKSYELAQEFAKEQSSYGPPRIGCRVVAQYDQYDFKQPVKLTPRSST
jgi:hypothetical protein